MDKNIRCDGCRELIKGVYIVIRPEGTQDKYDYCSVACRDKFHAQYMKEKGVDWQPPKETVDPILKANKEIEKTNNKKLYTKLVFGSLIVIFIIVAVVQSGKPEPPHIVDKYDIIVTAENCVKQNLKSPKTAEFCNSAKYDIKKIDEKKWTISGCVDSQNGFGAMLRSDFSMEVIVSADGKTANCNNLIIK